MNGKNAMYQERNRLLERFSVLREQYTLLFDQYEGWKRHVLPDVRSQMLHQLQWDIQQYQRRLRQFQNDLSVYRKGRPHEKEIDLL